MRFNLTSDMPVFEDYTPALKALESSFRKAGLAINFLADFTPNRGKVIHIREKGNIVRTICIEGDSPAQAIKDVTAAVCL